MEPDNMLKETNNQPQTSVFGFEVYPEGNMYSSIYSSSPQHNLGLNYNINSCVQFSNPMLANYVPSKSTAPTGNPQVPSSFNFGSPDTPLGYNPFATQSFCNQLAEHKIMLGKRKTDSPPLQPCKQLITEEKMAEHMSKLHISSETATSILEPESVKNKRLYMCEEMRKLQAEPIIPPSLIPGIPQPCTALVLWQPSPTKKLPVIEEPSSSKEEDENEPSKNLDIQFIETVETNNDLLGGDMDLDS
ncbi:uncharacterized protein LOC126735001 [Anthonomus grandis grandis]|uniref:uncharacterized protein LOC126735001 n=1 Tax=Anthonomus grandis grandis TaxID=2921223 RepID=UPI002164F837|nr:uncharacterized protein LOC126735001 [Anthonomus grandis grandis]